MDDLTQIDPDIRQRAPVLGRFRGETTAFDESIPTLLLPLSEKPCVVQHDEKPPLVTVSLSFPIAPAVIPVGPAPGPAVLPLPAAAIPALPAQDEAMCYILKMKPRILSFLDMRFQMTTRHVTQVHVHPPRKREKITYSTSENSG